MAKKTFYKHIRLLQCLLAACVILGMQGQRAQGATITPWGSVWGPTGINLGAADSYGLAVTGTNGYAAFTIGGSFVTTDTIKGTSDNSSGNSVYVGDVGVAGNYINPGTLSQAYNSANNSYSFASFTNTTLNGKLILDSGITYSATSSTISSGVTQLSSGVNALSQGVYDAINAGNQANSLTVSPLTNFSARTGVFSGYVANNSPTYSSVSMTGGSAGFSLSPSSTSTVIKLQNFTMNGGTFTLTGTASTKVIIDVYGTFSLQNAAQITLAGGLKWNNVLWNIYGLGSDVTLTSSTMTGYVLALQRNVLMNAGTINGEAIVGGQQLYLSNASKITKPPKVSH